MTRRSHKITKPPTLQEVHLKEEHHHAHPCLNCKEGLVGAYCYNCGQKATTHRYSVISFVTHDLLHSLWHVDKSILKTLKEVMIRPGIAARRDIAGERAKRFPILTLLLLIMAAFLLVFKNDYTPDKDGQIMLGEWDVTEAFLTYQKWILLSFIPIFALAKWPVYKKSGYNYAEQVIVGCYGAAFTFAWACIIGRLPEGTPGWVDAASFYILTGSFLLVHWQVYRKYFSLAGWIWRVLVYLLLCAFLLLLLVLILYLIGNR